MKNFIEKFRNFMYGRYGYDKLNFALVVAYLLINGIGSVIFWRSYGRIAAWAVALVLLGIAVFRFLSKDIYKRQQEEIKFENFLFNLRLQDRAESFKKRNKKFKLKYQYRKTHRFRTCPNCGENLRLTKKRGKREITCPKCGHHFTTRIIF